MAYRKRPLLEEFEATSQVAKNAKLHGVISSVSSMKSSHAGSMYFEGAITDGKKNIRYHLMSYKACQNTRELQLW